MITSEVAVMDTNVLVYAADEMSPFHVPSRDLRDRGVRGDEKLCIFLFQILTLSFLGFMVYDGN
jgi:hypothetical protein